MAYFLCAFLQEVSAFGNVGELDMRYGWRALLRSLVLHIGPPLLIIVLAVFSFQMGVNVSDRGDIPDREIFVQLYYAVGLFTLGGMDLGMPIDGPIFWRSILLLDYFLAPLIAAAAIIEGLYLTIRPWMILHWPWTNHIIVAGGGRIALSFVRICRKKFPHLNIIIVEKKEEYPNKDIFLSMSRVYPLTGNIEDFHLMKQLRIVHSRFFLLLTSDEVLNLQTAFLLMEYCTKPLIIRTADLRLIERANRLLPKQSIPPCINIHQEVAKHYSHEVQTFVRSSQEKDVIVLSGFGRFAQTFLRGFLLSNSEQIGSIFILDPKADFCWAVFEDSLFPKEREVLKGVHVHCLEDIQRDPRVWKKVWKQCSIEEDGHNLVVLFASNLDQDNVRCALWLSDQFSKALISVRLFHASPFSKELSKNTNVHIIDSAKILTEPISAWLDAMEI